MYSEKQHDKAAAFVLDWKKRTGNKQRKYTFFSLAAFLLAVVVCIVSFYLFQNINYDRIVDLNMKSIQDRAIQSSIQAGDDLHRGQERIRQIANQCTVLLNASETMDANEIINSFENQTIFTEISFVGLDGIYGDKDVSNHSYFRSALKGETGYKAVDIIEGDNKQSVVFYSPVMKNGEVYGVLIGVYGPEKFDNLFDFGEFNFVPSTYIITEQGEVVLRSDNAEKDRNIFYRLSKLDFKGDIDFERLQKIIDSDEENTTTFVFTENGKTAVGTISQFRDNKWMVLSVLGGGVIDDMIGQANRSGIALLVTAIGVSMILLLVIFISFRKQKSGLEKEIVLSVDNLNKILKDERKQLSIIDTLVDIYTSVYYTDAATLRYQRLKENAEISAIVPDTGDTKIAHINYVSEFVEDKFKDEMYEFMDADTIAQRLESENVITHEYRRKGKGWQRAMFASVSRDESDRVLSFIFAVQVIDEEKTKELESKEALADAYNAAQIANAAKTTFLSNMSHDIRTPMNAIIGMTAIAGVNIDNKDKVLDCLGKITTSSKHLLGLINEVLDMSKIESGNIDLAEEEFSLSDTINNLIALNQSIVHQKNQELSVKINNVVHEDVVGDSVRLQQVLTNMLSNATKYTGEGGKIDVVVTEKPMNNPKFGMYEISFEDNGIGMTPEFLKTIFEPFARADDERISKIQGTGLGMPIARNIIRMMNGDIKVESELNKGSKFTVSFILKLKDGEEASYENLVDLDVLIVDDDEVSCECTCMVCDSLGMNSEYVLSGREAVEKTVERHNNQNDYYAIIMDWKMPGMNGIEATREIRKSVGREVPIIVLTSYDWTEIEQEARAAGVNAFLSKPLFKSKIAHIFNDMINDGKNSEMQDVKSETQEHDFTGRRILLVEDNELNREIGIEILSMFNVDVETAVNGKEGVEKFSQSEAGYYDLVFMDIQMPVMNGYEATTAIRNLSHPDAKSIPIVAMTANAFVSDVAEARNAGMNAHIAKPIDINQIIKTLYEYFD